MNTEGSCVRVRTAGSLVLASQPPAPPPPHTRCRHDQSVCARARLQDKAMWEKARAELVKVEQAQVLCHYIKLYDTILYYTI